MNAIRWATFPCHVIHVKSVFPALIKVLARLYAHALGHSHFKVVHTPGHRPGSICLYDQKNRTLITGDSVCGDRIDLIRMDKNIYIRSLKKLLDLDIEVSIKSHPFKPLGKSILTRNEPKDMIQASIDIAAKLK